MGRMDKTKLKRVVKRSMVNKAKSWEKKDWKLVHEESLRERERERERERGGGEGGRGRES